MPTCCSAPRSSISMNGSPAICAENRVQRAQSTQRSRSSSTCAGDVDRLGEGPLDVRGTAISPRPLLIAWFCSGHSPPLSQTGQSSGWLISSSSITPCCALSATGEVSWVLTTMPSARWWCTTRAAWAGPSTSTRHCRQAPTGSSSGWSQNRGIWMPSSSAARITSVPLGTWTSNAVDGDVDEVGPRLDLGAAVPVLVPELVTVIGRALPSWRRTGRAWTRPGRTGSRRARGGRGTRRGSTPART